MAKGFKMPGNMQQVMRQAQKLQQDLARVQEETKAFEEEAASGGGMVKVRVNGRNRVVSVEISRDVVDPNDIEMLQDLILAAANEALNKVQEKANKALEGVTGGINIPGLS